MTLLDRETVELFEDVLHSAGIGDVEDLDVILEQAAWECMIDECKTTGKPGPCADPSKQRDRRKGRVARGKQKTIGSNPRADLMKRAKRVKAEGPGGAAKAEPKKPAKKQAKPKKAPSVNSEKIDKVTQQMKAIIDKASALNATKAEIDKELSALDGLNKSEMSQVANGIDLRFAKSTSKARIKELIVRRAHNALERNIRNDMATPPEDRRKPEPKKPEPVKPAPKKAAAKATPTGTKKAPKPPKPGFTGTDSLGRKWQDGKLVKKQEEPKAEKPAKKEEPKLAQPGAKAGPHAGVKRSKVSGAMDIYDIPKADSPAEIKLESDVDPNQAFEWLMNAYEIQHRGEDDKIVNLLNVAKAMEQRGLTPDDTHALLKHAFDKGLIQLRYLNEVHRLTPEQRRMLPAKDVGKEHEEGVLGYALANPEFEQRIRDRKEAERQAREKIEKPKRQLNSLKNWARQADEAHKAGARIDYHEVQVYADYAESMMQDLGVEESIALARAFAPEYKSESKADAIKAVKAKVLEGPNLRLENNY